MHETNHTTWHAELGDENETVTEWRRLTQSAAGGSLPDARRASTFWAERLAKTKDERAEQS